MLDYFKNRFREPSTHAGLAAIAVSLGQLLFPQYAMAIGVVAGIFGFTAAAMPNPKS